MPVKFPEPLRLFFGQSGCLFQLGHSPMEHFENQG